MPIQPEILLILAEESLVNPIWVGKEDEHEACPPREGYYHHQTIKNETSVSQFFILNYGSMMQ